MKFKEKKRNNKYLSDKIADALTIKPKADIEDDHIFNTKPNTVSRADFSSSGSEDEAVISDFRKRNINLLSDISKKYEGKVVSRKELKESSAEGSSEEHGLHDDSGNDNFNNKYNITDIRKQISSDHSDNERDRSGEEINDINTKRPRKQSNSDSSDDDQSEESGDYDITSIRKQINSDGSDSESDEDGDENDQGDAGYDISEMKNPVKEVFEHVKKQNISEDAKKGICVRNQLLLWEGLLEMRIHLQKCINSANKMPLPEFREELKLSKDFLEESNVVVTNISSVLEKLLSLQASLLRKFPETKTLSATKEGKDEKLKIKEDSDEEIPSDTDNEEIPSDTENEDTEENNIKTQQSKNKIRSINNRRRKLTDYEHDIATCHKKFKSFRDSTIQKWNEKTRVASAANIKNAPSNTILQQISYILSDRNKLVQRTQLKRSDYDIIGFKRESNEIREENTDVNTVIKDRKDNDEYIPEIFDDSDFYHQLLRELIECKSSDISDPIQLSRQWISLQQMRSKMKRKVDTKATKGRKIKYVVHNKLLNLMAPEISTKWNEESTNELYSSLFGKMFEQNNVGLNVNLDNISIK